MGTVVMYSTVSVDGFIADSDDQPGPLFEWLTSGNPPGGIPHVVVVTHRPAPDGWNPEAPFHFVDGIEAAIATAQDLAGDSHVLSLSPLAGDLRGAATTPNYSFVTPNTCADGHDWPKCQDGTPGRLRRVDESGDSDAGACCGEVDSLGFTDPSHPNLKEVGLYGPGGGRVGAIVLSRYVKPGG